MIGRTKSHILPFVFLFSGTTEHFQRAFVSAHAANRASRCPWTESEPRATFAWRVRVEESPVRRLSVEIDFR